MSLNLRTVVIATSLTLASAFTFAQAPATAVATPVAKPAVAAPAPVAAPAAVTSPVAAPAASAMAKVASKPVAVPASATPTAAPGGGAGKVWVNTGSKTYHCEGTKYYGKTKEGEYMAESAAKAKGNHGVGGKGCAAK